MATRKTAKRGIKSLGDKRYELRIYVNGRDYIRTIEAESTLEAEGKRLTIAAEIAEKMKLVEPSVRLTVSDVAGSWLNRQLEAKRKDGSDRIAPTTADKYKNAIKLWIVKFIGPYAIDELTPEIILDWRDSIAEQLASTTVNSHLAILQRVLHSVKCDAADDIEDLEEDDTRITDDEPNMLTAEEMKRFLTAAREKYPHLLPLILFLATTGTRISTARAVRWEDIDRDLVLNDNYTSAAH